MKAFLSDPDVTLYHGDALTVLQGLPAESVHMCVTSPPFYGLRDYGTGSWEGGNPDCDHLAPPIGGAQAGSPNSTLGPNRDGLGPDNAAWAASKGAQFRDTCGKCGARRVDQQIGLEETPEQWVENLVNVFREVRRVLREDGTLWLEVGDSYNGSGTNTLKPEQWAEYKRTYGGYGGMAGWGDRAGKPATKIPGLKPKDLIGAPWQLAFALRADGWYLRSDIVWARPNPMPESVTDRPTKSHSYIFLLSKSPRYFFDQEAVREPHHDNGAWIGRNPTAGLVNPDRGDGGAAATTGNLAGRNVRSVWTIVTQPYPEAHFATFPEELARRCILAGTSERGCCPECGAPWIRQVERELEATERTSPPNKGELRGRTMAGNRTADGWVPNRELTVSTTGWRLACVHDGHAPCVVLDPFVGSGTVPYVARKHGRHAIGIDLNADYLALAAKRLQQQSLFTEAQ